MPSCLTIDSTVVDDLVDRSARSYRRRWRPAPRRAARRPRAVDAVALGQQGRHFRDRSGASGVCGVAGAPARAFFRRGIQIDFHVGLREHDGADVASLHHDRAAFARASAADGRGPHGPPGSRATDAAARSMAGVRMSPRDVDAVDRDAVRRHVDDGTLRHTRDRMFVGRAPRRRAAPSSPTARYIAPLSTCLNPSDAATALATVPLPAPEGPSIAMIIFQWRSARPTSPDPLDLLDS